LWGGDITGLGNAAGWTLKKRDVSKGLWNIGIRPTRLLDVQKMGHAGNMKSPGTFARFRSLPPHDALVNVDHGHIQTEMDRIRDEYTGLGPALYHTSLATNCSPEDQLAEVVRNAMDEQLLPVLPNASVWLLKVDSALSNRFALTRVLLQVEDDPKLLSGRPQQFAGFNSARGLFSDTLLGLAAYLSPLLLSLSPYIWGFLSPRVGGVIIYCLGAPVPGRFGHSAEPLQLFSAGDGTGSLKRPQIQSSSFDAALRWWTVQLNAMFHEITDPRNYVSPQGYFLVRRQFAALLSLEQAFRNVQSISTLQREGHARRVVYLDTIDTLEGMNLQLKFHDMCKLSRARSTLEQLEQTLPSSVAEVLLPRARRAVGALADLQSGFFLPSRSTSAGIRLPDKNQGERIVSPEDAAASWLRVLRNAGHAFGTRNEASRARDEALLLAHDGVVPHDLADLAYLYLLRLVANPGLLKRGGTA
jgi:hypothetical protein